MLVPFSRDDSITSNLLSRTSITDESHRDSGAYCSSFPRVCSLAKIVQLQRVQYTAPDGFTTSSSCQANAPGVGMQSMPKAQGPMRRETAQVYQLRTERRNMRSAKSQESQPNHGRPTTRRKSQYSSLLWDPGETSTGINSRFAATLCTIEPLCTIRSAFNSISNAENETSELAHNSEAAASTMDQGPYLVVDTSLSSNFWRGWQGGYESPAKCGWRLHGSEQCIFTRRSDDQRRQSQSMPLFTEHIFFTGP